MKRFTLLILSLLSVQLLISQITVDPPFPTADEPVTVYLNTEGTGLEGYSGTIYAHTGITINGENWQNVIGEWGDNPSQPALEELEPGSYKLEIIPSIREFYSASQTDNITEMSFVFRSSDGSQQTSPDIFYDVYEQSLALLVTAPEFRPVIVQLNETITVEWNTNMADSSFLFIDDNLVFADTGSTFSYDITASEFGKKWVRIEARNAQDVVSETFYYYVRSEVTIEELPAGTRDGINYIDDNRIVFSLYAPEKEFVFVIGDFNDWEVSDEGYMKQTPDGDHFWIEINGLEPGMQYVFQYFIDGTIRVGDMYCEQVSDPWNDQYIPSSTYPDLPEYPYEKTSGIASVVQTGQEEYAWQTTDFTPPKKEDLVIYELLVRDFVAAHDYNTITDTLDYLQRLGVNAIELMPVNEFEGNLSWGYNPNYYFAADKYYGHRNTLKAFIDECHNRGIAVIMDIVLNHAYGTCPFVLMYWDTENNRPAANNPWFNQQSNFTNPDAQWGNDFNHESPETQQLVDSINSYWMSEYRFDGFRFDFTKGFGNNIKDNSDPWGSKYDADRIALLKRMSDEIWKRNPEAYVIFEHLSDNSEEKELADYGIMMWGNLNYSYSEAAMGWHDGGKSDFSWISYQKRGWDEPNVVGYAESHDEERMMFRNVTYGNSTGEKDIKDTTVALHRQQLIGNFFFTIPGPKMIWQFGERGYDYSIDYNGRLGEKPPRWDYMDNWKRRTLLYTWSSLIELKKEHDVFETDDYDLDVNGALKKIRLTSDEMSVVVLGNFDVEEGSIDPEFYSTGTWYEFWTGEEMEVTDVNAPISLQAGEYRLYTDKKLDTPDFVGIDENTDRSLSDFILYPNPASEQVTIALHLKDASEIAVTIYDLHGRKIDQWYTGQLPGGLKELQGDVSSLETGLYFINIRTGKGYQQTRKLFVK